MTERTPFDADPDPDRAVPPGDSPAACPHCGRPFPDPEYRDLHVGLAHAGACSEEERAAFAAAREAEADDLRRFQLTAVGLLVVLYFGLLITYAVAA